MEAEPINGGTPEESEETEAEETGAEEETQGELSKEDQEPPQPEPPKKIIVSVEDRLRAENLQLKLMNTVNIETIAQQQLNEATRRKNEVVVENEKYKAELQAKYGIDLRTHLIHEVTGEVLPRNPSQIMQNFRGMSPGR